MCPVFSMRQMLKSVLSILCFKKVCCCCAEFVEVALLLLLVRWVVVV